MTSGKQAAEQVYQLKITLRDSKPPIWRRVQVPATMKLDRLHHVIQIVMGWEDAHLHEFETADKRYGSPENDPDYGIDFAQARAKLLEMIGIDASIAEDMSFGPPPLVDESTVMLADVAPGEGFKFSYLYDFGDSWDHTILVEKILPADPAAKYPVCIKGVRAAPPDDCGGIWGYYRLLEAIADPKHPEHKYLLDWVGEPLDPEAFDLEDVNRRLLELEEYVKSRERLAEGSLAQLPMEELEQVTNMILSILSEALEEIRDIPGGCALRFDSTAEVWIAVSQFVLLEYSRDVSQRIVLELEPGEGPIWLRVTGSEGAVSRLKELFGSE